jgi:hypothetical protein
MNKNVIVIRVNPAAAFWAFAMVAFALYLNATFTYLNMARVNHRPRAVKTLHFEDTIAQEIVNLNKQAIIDTPDVIPAYRPTKSGRIAKEKGGMNEAIASAVKAKSEKNVRHFTEEEYVLGAIVLHGEAGAIPSITEQSGVLWTIWNRVLDDLYPNDIKSVVTQEGQFDGYTINGVYTKKDYDLAVDVFERGWREAHGESSESVGRTLPKDYLYFYGDGKHNYFVKQFGQDPYVWGSQFISPYEN